MADVGTPTPEDLRSVPEAAWLWDGARARIVWANPAGVAYFGGASLFHLVDRPFDFQEPGVEQVMRLSRSLWISWFVRYDPNWKDHKPDDTERVVEGQMGNW